MQKFSHGIAPIGLGAAIVKPIVGLTKAITKLTVSMENLDERLDTLSEKKSEAPPLTAN